MRDNWQMNFNNSSSESVNSPKEGNVSMDAKRLYDFSRPISAPPSGEFGFDVSFLYGNIDTYHASLYVFHSNLKLILHFFSICSVRRFWV